MYQQVGRHSSGEVSAVVPKQGSEGLQSYISPLVTIRGDPGVPGER